MATGASSNSSSGPILSVLNRRSLHGVSHARSDTLLRALTVRLEREVRSARHDGDGGCRSSACGVFGSKGASRVLRGRKGGTSLMVRMSIVLRLSPLAHGFPAPA